MRAVKPHTRPGAQRPDRRPCTARGGGDELNRIERRRNDAWPVVTHGINDDGRPIADRKEAPGMENPSVDWTPSIAASRFEFATGNRFPGGPVTHTEAVFKKARRGRDIETGPDGFLYVALEAIGEPGRIVRLVPAEIVAHQP